MWRASGKMRTKRSPLRYFAAFGDAERCWVLQSAVAFWGVLLGFAIGCDRSTNNVTKYQISSSSMAPTWFGPHLKATCSACGQRSEIVLEAYDPAVPTRCSSCGAVCDSPNKLNEDEIKPGEVIEIIRPASSTGLKRFDLVTFSLSTRDSSTQVSPETSPETLKRIWALPDEDIELHDGKAFIDGKVLQMNLREFAQICIPISRFPNDTRSHWWVTDTSNNQGTRIEDAATQRQLILERGQQLEFRYMRPNRNPEVARMLPSSVVSDFPFNQNSIAKFYDVADVLLAIEFVKPTSESWSVSIQSEGKRYLLGVSAHGDASGNSVKLENVKRMVIAACDGRMLVSTERMDHEWNLAEFECDQVKVDQVKVDQAPVDSLISITTTDALHISRLLVARDQWLGPRESRETDWTRVGNEDTAGYFVLGDNMELSVDSRDASVGRISPDRIAGQAKRLTDTTEWIQELLKHTFREVGGVDRKIE